MSAKKTKSKKLTPSQRRERFKLVLRWKLAEEVVGQLLADFDGAAKRGLFTEVESGRACEDLTSAVQTLANPPWFRRPK